MKKSFPFMALILFSLMAIGCGGSGNSESANQTDEPYQTTITRMRAQINELMNLYRVTGLSVALVDGQNIIWAEGFGWADLAGKIPAKPETIYEIGSISKTMTATLVMQLVEKGYLDIRVPVTNYLPGFSINQRFPGSGPITLETLMTHHSGIPGDILPNLFTIAPDPVFPKNLINYLTGDYTTYPTNYFLAYSNSAMVVLSEVAAAVCGSTFAVCGDRLLNEIGMENSSFIKPEKDPHLSQGFFLDEAWGPYYCNGPATGGVHSNVLDMTRYIMMILGNGQGVISPGALNSMVTPHNTGISLDMSEVIGLNWFLSRDELNYAGRLAWHNGATMMFNGDLVVLLDHGLGAVALSNSATGQSVVKQVVINTLKLALEEKTGLTPPTPDPLPAPANWPQSELDALTGFYIASGPPGYYGIRAIPGALEFKPRNGNIRILDPLENGWLRLRDTDYLINFIVLDGRSVMVLHYGLTEGNILAERYAPQVIPGLWTARTGTYDVTNLSPIDASNRLPAGMIYNAPSITVNVENGMLVLDDGGSLGPFVINPRDDALGVFYGLGRDNGAVVQADDTSGNTDLSYLGLVYRKISDRVITPQPQSEPDFLVQPRSMITGFLNDLRRDELAKIKENVH